MFRGLKRLVRKIANAVDDATAPDSFDAPRPQRVNPDPPKDDWFSRTRARSARAEAETTKQVDELLAKAAAGTKRR